MDPKTSPESFSGLQMTTSLVATWPKLWINRAEWSSLVQPIIAPSDLCLVINCLSAVLSLNAGSVCSTTFVRKNYLICISWRFFFSPFVWKVCVFLTNLKFSYLVLSSIFYIKDIVNIIICFINQNFKLNLFEYSNRYISIYYLV